MSIIYSEMTDTELKAEGGKIVGQIKGARNALGRYTHAVLQRTLITSNGEIIAHLYRLLKAEGDVNATYLRAIRHATIDCTGFVLNCSNDKTNGIVVKVKRDQEAWALIKGDIANANMFRLIGEDGLGAGLGTFVNRPKIKKSKKSSNDDDAGNGEVKNAYEAAVSGIADIMTEINAIAPNDAEVLADLQTLLAMEAKLKAKLLELKGRMANRMTSSDTAVA
jgi:hypothetical protein|tara:strand:- start:167 stop:832 length:666 start_codon:yes stop_codon:yes gene_type:complete